jgi:hypothetical protein
MLTYVQSIGIVLLSVLCALGVLWLLNRRLEDTTRKRANGVNGWQLSILGTLYAVALGFMLSDAWLAYQTAEMDVQAEAAAARMIHRTAGLMPAACAQQLQQQVQNYVVTVIQKEWPAMEMRRNDDSAQPIVAAMWTTLGTCEEHESLTAHESIIQALSTLQSHRDARVQDFNGHLPAIMWTVLLFGGVIVIAASCLLGNEKQWIHCFHVVSLTVLVILTLLAISDLDRPFDGITRVDSAAFRGVERNFHGAGARPAARGTR